MVAVKVWLGGEGPSELGTRADGGDDPGVIEALLLKVEPSGGWITTARTRLGRALRGR